MKHKVSFLLFYCVPLVISFTSNQLHAGQLEGNISACLKSHLLVVVVVVFHPMSVSSDRMMLIAVIHSKLHVDFLLVYIISLTIIIVMQIPIIAYYVYIVLALFAQTCRVVIKPNLC